MELRFSSIDEIKDFMAQLKGTRGKKGENDDAPTVAGNVPAPIPVPVAPAFQAAGLVAPQVQHAAQAAAGPFAPVAGPVASPEVLALLTRITGRVDALIAGTVPGTAPQAPDKVLEWLRSQLGPEAAMASMEQVKAVFMPRLTQPALEQIAKLIGA